jgi:hypothetical protein
MCIDNRFVVRHIFQQTGNDRIAVSVTRWRPKPEMTPSIDLQYQISCWCFYDVFFILPAVQEILVVFVLAGISHRRIKFWVFWHKWPQNVEQWYRDPQKAHPCVKTCLLSNLRLSAASRLDCARAWGTGWIYKKHGTLIFYVFPQAPSDRRLQLFLAYQKISAT